LKNTILIGLLAAGAALGGCSGQRAEPAQQRARPAALLGPGLSVDPADGASGVPVNGAVSVTFSTDMDAATVDGTTFALASAAGPVAGTVAYDAASRTAVFAPAALLANDTLYTATLDGVRALAGDPLVTSTWSFTTARAETTPPAVLETVPSAGAVAFAPNSALAVTFSEPVDVATVDATTFTLAGPSGSVPGTVTYDAPSRSALFTPSAQLAGNTLYAATVSAAIRDLASNAMGAPVTWSFTTAPAVDATPPEVTASAPAAPPGSEVDAGAPITATFSEPLDPRTISASTFTMEGVSGAVSGAVSYDPSILTATFTPAAELSRGATYTAAVDVGVRDLAGNALAQRVSWTFDVAVRYSGFVSDIRADHDGHVGTNSNAWRGQFETQGIRLGWVVTQDGDHWLYEYRLDGAQKAVGKTVNSFCIGTPEGFASTDLLAGWSLVEPVNGVEEHGSVKDGVATDVTSILTRPGSAQSYTAVSGLATAYGIRWRMAGGYFQEDVPNMMFTLTFSTRRAPTWGDVILESDVESGGGPTTAWNTHTLDWTDAPLADGNNGGWVLVPGIAGTDTEPPEVRATRPAADSAGLGIHDAVTAAFSEAIDGAGLIGAGGFTLADGGGAPVAGTVTYDPLAYVATFTPSASLAYDGTYSARVEGATDLAGHALEPVSWTFATESPDITVPRVIATSPREGDADVALGAAVTATFSKAIDPSNLPAAFTLSGATGAVVGTVAYAPATNTATFTPAYPLAYDTTYTATVAGISDASGNAMPAPSTWSFTTGSPPAYVPTGDVNGDGIVDVRDARLALRIAAGDVAPTSDQLRAGDVAPLVSGVPAPDGAIDVADALVILRKVAGQESW
jgi:hypothetical protein